MLINKLFWLHVKKSAGSSVRKLLGESYTQVDRTKKPYDFFTARETEYNDILNNYRTNLGDYQFSRALFAKKYLYPLDWDSKYSFAFSRNPTDRCVSMFHYLYWKGATPGERLKNTLSLYIDTNKIQLRPSYAFDTFLELVQGARHSDSNYYPLGSHFSTHTATMWQDVTDNDNKVLLTKIFRLEDLYEGINIAFEECGIPTRIKRENVILNKNKVSNKYSPNKEQIAKIHKIYSNDFDLYESSSI